VSAAPESARSSQPTNLSEVERFSVFAALMSVIFANAREPSREDPGENARAYAHFVHTKLRQSDIRLDPSVTGELAEMLVQTLMKRPRLP
jgi:hypothetical protein